MIGRRTEGRGRPPPDQDTDWGTYFKGLFRYAMGIERDIESYRD